MNEKAVRLWRQRDSGKVDWEGIAKRCREARNDPLTPFPPIDDVASAVLYMYGGLRMPAATVAEHFGEKPGWFGHMIHWASLHPDARPLFSLRVGLPDALPLFEARIVASSRPEKHAQGARNLIRARKVRNRADAS